MTARDDGNRVVAIVIALGVIAWLLPAIGGWVLR